MILAISAIFNPLLQQRLLETDPVIRFEFDSDSLLAPDGNWSVSESNGGSLRPGHDRGLVANSKRLEITLARR